MPIFHFVLFVVAPFASSWYTSLHLSHGKDGTVWAFLIFGSLAMIFLAGYIFRARMYGRAYVVHPLSFEYGPFMAIGSGMAFASGGFVSVGWWWLAVPVLVIGVALFIVGLREGPVYGYD